MNKIFLGGTCGETKWREWLEDKIKVDCFNPVVEDWTPECQAVKIIEKEERCNIHFYCITSEMKGVFSIAEVVDSVHNKNKRTILQVRPNGFDEGQLRSLKAVVDLVNSRGGIAYIDDDLRRADIILTYAFGGNPTPVGESHLDYIFRNPPNY